MPTGGERIKEVTIMAIEKVREYFAQWGLQDQILEFDVSSATVELAAQALHCEGCRIAKTLSFLVGEESVLVVAAGDARVDNHKFKTTFGVKAKMIPADEVEQRVGHAIGGVCPFGVNAGARVFLDESLRRFETVYPACGSSNSAIRLSIPELEKYAAAERWVDVCKDWQL